MIKLEQQQLTSFTDILVRNLWDRLWKPNETDEIASILSIPSKIKVESILSVDDLVTLPRYYWTQTTAASLETVISILNNLSIQSFNRNIELYGIYIYQYPELWLVRLQWQAPERTLLCIPAFRRSHIPPLQSWLAIFVTPIWKIS